MSAADAARAYLRELRPLRDDPVCGEHARRAIARCLATIEREQRRLRASARNRARAL